MQYSVHTPCAAIYCCGLGALRLMSCYNSMYCCGLGAAMYCGVYVRGRMMSCYNSMTQVLLVCFQYACDIVRPAFTYPGCLPAGVDPNRRSEETVRSPGML